MNAVPSPFAPLPLHDRIRLRIDLGRLRRRIDRRAFAALRLNYRGISPSAYDSKYWQLDRQLRKNLHRAFRLGLHRPPAGLAVLDLGTGFGFFPTVCRLHHHRAIGLDVDDGSDSLYAMVTATLGVERLVGAIRPYEPLPVIGRRFDLVTGFAVMFNDPEGEPWGAGEWHFFLFDVAERLLSVGGRLFLTLNRDRHGRYLDPETLEMFRAAGGDVEGSDVHFRVLDPSAVVAARNTTAAAAPAAMEA